MGAPVGVAQFIDGKPKCAILVGGAFEEGDSRKVHLGVGINSMDVKPVQQFIGKFDMFPKFVHLSLEDNLKIRGVRKFSAFEGISRFLDAKAEGSIFGGGAVEEQGVSK